MTPRPAHRRVSINVGQRLFLGLLPSLLAVALVVGLAYYGEYGREAPDVVVVAAAVLALSSLVITWTNTRYLAGRIARLAGATGGAGGRPGPEAPTPASGGDDELDRIEQVVDRLGSALTVSEAERARANEAAAARLHEHATMLSATVRSALAQLDEVRLPLHILLDARFGDLNENQEELLASARSAADAMDAALRRLGQVADADRGALPVQRELVQVNDVVRAVLPLAHAAAERRGARVDVALEPGLPRVLADRVRLAEALALLSEASAELVGVERPLVITTAREQGVVSVTIAPSPRSPAPKAAEHRLAGAPTAAPAEPAPADASADGTADPTSAHNVVLGLRLVEAQGGRVQETAESLTVRLG